MKPSYFHPEALVEADHAANFYEGQQTGLGTRFLDGVEDALTRIQRHPRLFQIVSGTLRKCRILRFPYGVIFREQHARIEIIAIMHLKRRPGYWKTRPSK